MTRWWISASSSERSYAVGVFLMTVVGFVLYGQHGAVAGDALQTLLGYPPLQAYIASDGAGAACGSFSMMPITGPRMTGQV